MNDAVLGRMIWQAFSGVFPGHTPDLIFKAIQARGFSGAGFDHVWEDLIVMMEESCPYA